MEIILFLFILFVLFILESITVVLLLELNEYPLFMICSIAMMLTAILILEILMGT